MNHRVPFEYTCKKKKRVVDGVRRSTIMKPKILKTRKKERERKGEKEKILISLTRILSFKRRKDIE